MRKALLAAIGVVALAAGCARREQIYFRPTGDNVFYGYTYYPEMMIKIPPGSSPAARAAIGARGIVKERDQDVPLLYLNVKVVVDNPTLRTIQVRRGEQFIANFNGRSYQAVLMRAGECETDTAVIGPGERQVLRLQFWPGRPPGKQRVSFQYRFRYSVYAQTYPEDVQFVRVMPGEIKPPPAWDGVIIFRF